MAILEMQNRIVEALCNKLCCIGLYIDLSKAFDTLNHSVLLSKLYHYGVRGTSLKWFESYLNDRLQFTYHLTDSGFMKVLCGVPQGSILGPLLFILFINDLVNTSQNHQMILFADDTSILYTGKNMDSLISEINNSLRSLSDWFAANKLSLNIDKTNFIIFHKARQTIPDLNYKIQIAGKEIKKVDSVKFLGVHLDDCLNWKTHLKLKATQIAKVNGILCKLKHQLPFSALKTIYNSLVLPHLSYAVISWGNVDSSELKRLEILQKKSIRIICNSKYLSHTGPLFKKFNLLRLNDLFHVSCCNLYYKHMKGLLPPYFHSKLHANRNIHNYNTRQQDLVHGQNITSVLQKQTINSKIASCWNALPHNVQDKSYLSLHCFTKHVKKHCISQYPSTCNVINCYVCQQSTNNN